MVEGAEIRRFILDRLEPHAARQQIPIGQIERGENLFEADVIDSLDLLELVDSVEQAFGVEIDIGDLEPAEFATLDGIVALFERGR